MSHSNKHGLPLYPRLMAALSASQEAQARADNIRAARLAELRTKNENRLRYHRRLLQFRAALLACGLGALAISGLHPW